MNFDFSWFLTIPGMLITGGVLLLIIALIVLIVSGRKDKKKKKNDSMGESLQADSQNAGMTSNVEVPVNVDNTMGVQPVPVVGTNPVQDMSSIPDISVNNNMPNMEMPQMPIESAPVVQQPTVMSTNMNMQSIPSTNTLNNNVSMVSPMMPVNDSVAPSVELQQAPIEAPVANIPVAPAVDANLTMPNQSAMSPEIPNMASNNVSMPVISDIPSVGSSNPVISQNAVPKIFPNPEVAPVAPGVQNVQPVVTNTQDQVSIYGGASPIVPKIDLEPEHHQIYGGADPSENTQSIPIINNFSNEASVVPNIQAQVPVSPEIVPTPTIVNPQVEQIQPQPQPQPQPQVQPQVQPIPTVETIPSVPVIQPTVDNSVDTI